MDRVIVGIDGSEGSQAALRFAAAEAAQWGVPLVAVEAWEFSPLVVATEAPTQVEALSAAVARKLQGTLVEVLGSDGADAVESIVVEDSPARALLDLAGEDDLIVIGSRGRGGFKGLVLGSVSQQVAHYAPCPVTIVRGG